MKCEGCGAELKPNAKFCEYCGAEVPHNDTYHNSYDDMQMGTAGNPFDMGKVYQVRNKLLYIDSNSKMFKTFCYVEIAILAILLIASLITKIMLVVIMAGIMLLAFSIYMLISKNKGESGLKFSMPSQVLLLIILTTILLLFMTISVIQFEYF